MNILIIEDESLIALELYDSITNLGYHVVDYITDTSVNRQYLQEKKINLILMDINLNAEIDGIDLYQKLQSDIHIIYLTAYKDETTMTKAIKTNPLGYLIKPHNINELKALLKLAEYKIGSQKELHQRMIPLGEGYVFHLAEDKLFHHDTFVNLGPKELKLLKLLIHARGAIVSFEMIEEHLWEDQSIGSSAVRTLIYRLRGKLEHRLIENVFNYGIKLSLPSSTK